MKTDSHPSPNNPNTKIKNYRIPTNETSQVRLMKSSTDKYSQNKHASESPQYHHEYNTYPYSNSQAYDSKRQSPQRDDQYESVLEIKAENSKLKKLLKETQAKRVQITKQCSQLSNKYDKLEEENTFLHRKIKDSKDSQSSEKFQYEQLKFLNKELNSEIEHLHKENEQLNEKLRYQTDHISRKYEQLEERTLKNIESALKRIKYSISYLSSLSAKDFEKTRQNQVQNLRKCIQVLKGKYHENGDYQQEIEELMNPIRNIQQDLHQKNKDVQILKEQNSRLMNEVKKHKKIEKELLPQYKEAIDKLKKNLVQLRVQLSENEYQKCQLKRKYEERVKQVQIKYEDLFKQNRKIRLENKIFEKKIEQMEDDVEEQKQRLMGENELLKKLYRTEDPQNSKRNFQKDLNLDGYLDDDLNSSQGQQSYERQPQRDNNRAQVQSKRTTSYKFKKGDGKTMEKQKFANHTYEDARDLEVRSINDGRTGSFLKKNYSANQLRVSRSKEHKQIIESYKKNREQSKQKEKGKKQLNSFKQYDTNENYKNKSQHGWEGKTKRERAQYEQGDEFEARSEQGYGRFQYQEESSMGSISQDGLKNQIFKIDQQIMEIQKTLDRELNMYK